MSYIRIKIENNRFKNPIARHKRKNLDKYQGSLGKRTRAVGDYDIHKPLEYTFSENCSFDVADVKVNDFIRFELRDLKNGSWNESYVEFVRVHSITDKEICFQMYDYKISWESHHQRVHEYYKKNY